MRSGSTLGAPSTVGCAAGTRSGPGAAAGQANRQDPPLPPRRSAAWTVPPAAGTVDHPVRAELAVAVGPALRPWSPRLETAPRLGAAATRPPPQRARRSRTVGVSGTLRCTRGPPGTRG